MRQKIRIISPIVTMLLLASWNLQASAIPLSAASGQKWDNETALVEEDLPRYYQKRGKVLHRELKGLVLLQDRSQMLSQDQLKDFSGFEVVGLSLPGKDSDLEKKLDPLFMNQPLTTESLAEIKSVISDYYASYHYPLVLVEVPEQDITYGVLQLVVIQGTLGKVTVEGNRYFTDDRLLNYLNLRADEPINERQIIQDVNFMNRNPFRRVDIVYAPGEETGQTDVTLMVEDRRPFRVYAGAENNGVPTTSRQRWLAGFNWGNVFGLDHVLGYQFTSAYHPSEFNAQALQYIAPLPWHHVLNVYGGYARVHADIPIESVKGNTGRSYQASGRYTIPLPPSRFLDHEFTFGFDWKRTNNTIEFAEQDPIIGDNVNLTQFIFGYGGNYERSYYRLDFGAELFWSPGRMVSDEQKERYQTLRPGADNNWVYILGQFAYLVRLPHSFSLSTTFKGQWTYRNLLPSEQFYFGGYDTVRGYDQRQVNKDNGVLLNTELRSPPFALLKYLKSDVRVPDALQFLIFLDYGWGINHQAIPGFPKAEWLMGVGPGIRYAVDPYLTARLDWGIKLHKKEAYTGGNTEVHFAVTASY